MRYKVYYIRTFGDFPLYRGITVKSFTNASTIRVDTTVESSQLLFYEGTAFIGVMGIPEGGKIEIGMNS